MSQERQYHPSGEVAVESSYGEDGLLDGPVTTYFSDGSVASKSFFKGGVQQGESLRFNSSGQVVARLNFRDGKKEGLQSYFYNNGQARSSLPYVSGRLHGTVDLYHQDGTPCREARYVEGRRQGTDTFWSGSGQMVFQKVFENGKPVKESFWSPEGVLTEERVHHHLPEKGTERTCWDGEGHLRLEGKYEGKRFHHQEWDRSASLKKEYYGFWDGKQVVIDQIVTGDLTTEERARFTRTP